MTDYMEGLVIGHNTLQSDCSMSAICHNYNNSLQSSKYKNTYMSMSYCYRRVIDRDGRVVNLPSFLRAVMTSSSSVGVVMSCQGSVAAQ